MESRRNFLKKALYVAPIVLTATVRPAHASSAYGSSTTGTRIPPAAGGGGGGSTGGGGGSSPWWALWDRV